jgi:hypothetical protein
MNWFETGYPSTTQNETDWLRGGWLRGGWHVCRKHRFHWIYCDVIPEFKQISRLNFAAGRSRESSPDLASHRSFSITFGNSFAKCSSIVLVFRWGFRFTFSSRCDRLTTRRDFTSVAFVSTVPADDDNCWQHDNVWRQDICPPAFLWGRRYLKS